MYNWLAFIDGENAFLRCECYCAVWMGSPTPIICGSKLQFSAVLQSTAYCRISHGHIPSSFSQWPGEVGVVVPIWHTWRSGWRHCLQAPSPSPPTPALCGAQGLSGGRGQTWPSALELVQGEEMGKCSCFIEGPPALVVSCGPHRSLRRPVLSSPVHRKGHHLRERVYSPGGN